MALLNDVAFVKCIAWLPVAEFEDVIAMGQTNGRITLSSIRGSSETCVYHGREYASKHTRQCHSVSWGVTEPFTLAGGFDKHKSEYSVIVWDVSRIENDTKPIMETGLGDSVASLEWFTQSQNLVAGVNGKFLRVYDMRGNTKTDISVWHKKVISINDDRWKQTNKFN